MHEVKQACVDALRTHLGNLEQPVSAEIGEALVDTVLETVILTTGSPRVVDQLTCVLGRA